MSFQTILVATDGSANAERAVDLAVDLAKRTDARLLLLHAVITHTVPEGLREWAEVEHLIEEPGPQAVPQGPAYGRLGVTLKEPGGRMPYRARLGLGEAVVEHAAKKARDAGVDKVDTSVEEGDPAEVIQAALEREPVDLVVMGTRGLGRLKNLLVGSTSNKVIGLHRCPVLTVP